MPGSDYLIQLRNTFYNKTDKKSYSNDQVIKLYKQNFNMIENQRLSYKVVLDEVSLKHLLNMTPLTWNIEKEKCQKLLKKA